MRSYRSAIGKPRKWVVVAPRVLPYVPRYIFRAETVRCATGHRSQIHTPFGPCSKDRDKDYLFPVSRKYIFIGIRTRWDPTSCSFVLFFRGLLIFTISLRYYRRREERRISNRLLIVNFPPMCKEMEQGTVAQTGHESNLETAPR